MATVDGLNVANVTVQANVNVTAGGYAGLVARYSGTGDSNMYWGALLNTGSGFLAVIYRNVNGVWAQLVAETVGTGVGALQFQVNGSSLELSLNGVLELAVIDTSLTSGTVGMRVGQSTVSSFQAS